MDLLAPVGPVYQAGTLSGNPLAMAAGRATLALLDPPGVRAPGGARRAGRSGTQERAARRAGIPGCVQRVGSMLTLFFGSIARQASPTRSEPIVSGSGAFFFAMLDRGFYLPPSPFEALFVSLAHADEDIDAFVAAAGEAVRAAPPAT